MGIKWDLGTIVVGVAIIIFYLRVLQLRGRKKKQKHNARMTKSEAADPEKAKKARKYGVKLDKPAENQDYNPLFNITNWWIAVAGIILMCLGLALNNSGWFPKPYPDYWWISLAAGVILFMFCIE